MHGEELPPKEVDIRILSGQDVFSVIMSLMILLSPNTFLGNIYHKKKVFYPSWEICYILEKRR